MEDVKIVERYWQRDERAIKLTEEKYGKYLRKSNLIEDISLYTGMSVPKIKSLLFRTRKELREYLLEEGFDL